MIDPQLRDEEVDDVIAGLQDVLTKGGGQVTAVEKWGRRTLAYPVRRRKEAFYCLLSFESDNAGLKTLEQVCKLNDKLLRHTVLRKTSG